MRAFTWTGPGSTWNRATITSPLPTSTKPSNWNPTMSGCGRTNLRQIRSRLRPLVRGLEGDLWADIILGKIDFSEIATNRVVPFKLFNPGGILVDRSTEPGKAYIWDSGNSRILGLDLAECYEGAGPMCRLELVIGQPSPYRPFRL